ncbi:MAG: hypothetical protein O2U61_05260, partial [Candidatus Bathyarchaeota archaeon]|nr:hypothetical protein [Candidatus Bathyarchaeota archaeon]
CSGTSIFSLNKILDLPGDNPYNLKVNFWQPEENFCCLDFSVVDCMFNFNNSQKVDSVRIGVNF